MTGGGSGSGQRSLAVLASTTRRFWGSELRDTDITRSAIGTAVFLTPPPQHYLRHPSQCLQEEEEEEKEERKRRGRKGVGSTGVVFVG